MTTDPEQVLVTSGSLSFARTSIDGMTTSTEVDAESSTATGGVLGSGVTVTTTSAVSVPETPSEIV